MRYNIHITILEDETVDPKQKIEWIILGIAVCFLVAVAILAVLPAWPGMGDMSALDAILYYIRNGSPLQ